MIIVVVFSDNSGFPKFDVLPLKYIDMDELLFPCTGCGATWF